MSFTLIPSSGLEILIILTIVAFIFYKYFTRNFDYWKKKGVPYVTPLPFFGNFLEIFLFRTTIGHYLKKFYNKFPSPYFGIYALNKPCLVVKDPDMVKLILVKDFNHFPDRTMVSDEKCDSMASNFPFFSKNPEWKFVRTKITPVFTAGKIKNMLPLINASVEEMKTYLDKRLDNIEIKEVSAKYATDAIATCAFGIDAHCFVYEDAQFRVIGKKMRDFQWMTTFRHTCYFFAPDLVRFFKMPFFDSRVIDFMRDTFWETLEVRRKTKSKRNDVIDAINQIVDNSTPEDDYKFEGDRVVAQAGQFYSAGFETISSTMSYTLYELCFQPKIQNRVRSEIKKVLAQHGGFTYEAIQDMKYLHMVICETLRKHPFVPFLDRMCVEDYKLPDSDLVIEKGTPVYIPLLAMQHDPEYFPEPDKYDPERFSDENKDNFPSFSYIPFGEGPRNCIGKRFGLMVVKLGLAQILLEYEVMKNAHTPVPMKFKTKGLFLVSTDDLPMKFKKIGSC